MNLARTARIMEGRGDSALLTRSGLWRLFQQGGPRLSAKMTVKQSQGRCTIEFQSRGGYSESELERLLLEVFRAVNPAAGLADYGATAESRALFNEGPMLFQHQARTSDGGTMTELGGLLVVCRSTTRAGRSWQGGRQRGAPGRGRSTSPPAP